MNRKIYINGPIDSNAFLAFSRRLSRLELDSPNAPIEVEISSEGGEAYAALAYFDRIRNSPCEVNITSYGLVASAAVLILAAGTKRRMGKSAWIMVHEDSGDFSGDTSSYERDAKHLRRMEDQWNILLERVTFIGRAKWSVLHKATTYLCARECLDLGLIDEII